MYDLTEFGFTPKQSNLYQAGLQLGTSSAARLARKAGIHRVSCYTMLQELVSKGFATTSKRKNVLYYTMVPPLSIHQKLKNNLNRFKELIPLLEATQQHSTNGLEVQVFQGFEGICSLYRARLATNVGACGFLGVDHIDPEMKDRLYEVHLPQRLKQDLYSRIIVSKTMANAYYADPNNVPQTEVLVIDDPLYDIQSEILLCAPYHIFISSLSTNELGGVHIKSEYLYNSMIQIFELIWRFGEK